MAYTPYTPGEPLVPGVVYALDSGAIDATLNAYVLDSNRDVNFWMVKLPPEPTESDWSDVTEANWVVKGNIVNHLFKFDEEEQRNCYFMIPTPSQDKTQRVDAMYDLNVSFKKLGIPYPDDYEITSTIAQEAQVNSGFYQISDLERGKMYALNIYQQLGGLQETEPQADFTYALWNVQSDTLLNPCALLAAGSNTKQVVFVAQGADAVLKIDASLPTASFFVRYVNFSLASSGGDTPTGDFLTASEDAVIDGNWTFTNTVKVSEVSTDNQNGLKLATSGTDKPVLITNGYLVKPAKTGTLASTDVLNMGESDNRYFKKTDTLPAPSNMVTTDSVQSITGLKTYVGGVKSSYYFSQTGSDITIVGELGSTKGGISLVRDISDEHLNTEVLNIQENDTRYLKATNGTVNIKVKLAGGAELPVGTTLSLNGILLSESADKLIITGESDTSEVYTELPLTAGLITANDGVLVPLNPSNSTSATSKQYVDSSIADALGTVVNPVLPVGTLDYKYMEEFFARNAQPDCCEAPIGVFVSRVPYARFDESSSSWVNTGTTVNESSTGYAQKFMDNAGLKHACSTNLVENDDDYVGKLWPFYWQHGNYETDEYGNKHITAIKGQIVNGVAFDETKNVCAFGPKFWFFCKTEKFYNTSTSQWTTHDGTESGVPLFQLWGISTRPWDELSEDKQQELTAHGVTREDLVLWPECRIWDSGTNEYFERPYWCHSAYMGGYEEGVAGVVSKPETVMRTSMSYTNLNSLYKNVSGMGGGAAVNGFGMLFDIVKNAQKNSQTIHRGMSDNYQTAVLATYDTGMPDYVFPIASQGSFEVGCTVKLWNSSSQGESSYIEGPTAQYARIVAIKNCTITLEDMSTVESLCLCFDSSRIKPFYVRTTVEATKELTDAGTYACCYARQGMSLAGETDAVIGKHDGSMTNNTNGKHPYRVQGTEYMAGAWVVSSDTVAIKGDGNTPVTVDGVTTTPDSSQYVILTAGQRVTRRTSGTLAQFLESGYTPVGLGSTVAGWILNEQLSKEGVAYPLASGGTGSSSSTGTADYLYVGSSPAEYPMAGHLSNGAFAGSSYLRLSHGLSDAAWDIAARD